MAKIKQVGIGRKSTGTIDGITYYVRGGVTFARSLPIMPASVYNTPQARKRQAVFKLIQMHLKYHLRTIKQTFSHDGNVNSCNRYYKVNGRALKAALDALADAYCAGQDVTLTDIENAISAYAANHPTSIRIASRSGYQDVFLTGQWPETITLNASEGDSTIVIIMGDNGAQTSINANGINTGGSDPEGGSGSEGSSDSGGDGDNGNGDGSDTD